MPMTPQRAALAARMSAGLGNVQWRGVPQGWVWGGGGGGLGALPPADAYALFLDWVRRAYGAGVVDALAAGAPAGELAATVVTEAQTAAAPPSWLDRLVSAAGQILPAYLQYEQQRDVLEIQLERARAGLPPLESGQFAPSVQVQLDEETVRRIGDEAIARAGVFGGKAIPWLMLGAAALFMLSEKRGRRR